MQASDSRAAMFKALGHRHRLAVFDVIRRGDGGCCPTPSPSVCACDIVGRLGLSPSMVSRHLRELRLAGLIRTDKRGQWVHCTVNPDAVESLRAFVADIACRA